VSAGASSWSFREDDAQRLQVILTRFLRDASARTALIVDRTGQLVATVGETPLSSAPRTSSSASLQSGRVSGS